MFLLLREGGRAHVNVVESAEALLRAAGPPPKRGSPKRAWVAEGVRGEPVAPAGAAASVEVLPLEGVGPASRAIVQVGGEAGGWVAAGGSRAEKRARKQARAERRTRKVARAEEAGAAVGRTRCKSPPSAGGTFVRAW